MILHRSNRIEALVDALAELVAVPLPDPFAPEWIAVQGRGMGRWLAMELARRLGVWANPKFPFPRRVIESAMTALLGPAVSEATVFDPQTLRWAVAEALPPLLERRAFDPIRRYLADDVRGAKRLQLAGRIAELFDQYAVYRPHMVLEWERGADSDWQAELWRAVVRIHGAEHAAARARALLRALSAGERPTSELPRRLSLFGISTLPPLYAEILAALAPSVELHLFVLSPSQEYWGDIRSRRTVQRSGIAAAEGHPLLASLGRVGRDFQSVLEEVADYQDDDRFVDPGMDSMLAVLQSDMLALHTRAPGAEHAPLALRSDEDSIAVHACHGPMREIEVLHDQLLALFDRDATLAPPDVVVMTPAIDAYAPLIEAVFGSGGRPQIPFRIADRSARAQHDVIDAFLRALELLRGRLPAPDVLDLLALEPVRARFDIAAEELERLRHWVAESGIRWGADADHRAAQGQPPCDENTWRFGLDRLLLGYALPGEDTRLFNGVLPYDDVEGSDAALLGRFAEFCDTLSRFRDAARDPRHPREWRGTLSALLGELMKSTTATAHEHHALNKAFEELARQADAGGFNGSVDLDTIRRLIEAEVEAGGSPRGFLTGAVTFCEMVPMRTIPFRVVCLIGLNDGAFPRARRPLGFDRMAESPRPGDRTARDDDRYLFLEAILAARERLVITYVGQSISDNTDLPPSVVINELLDTIDRSFKFSVDGTDRAGGARPRDRVVQRHALQPFSPRYFGAADEPSPLRGELGEARAAISGRTAGGPPAVPALFSYASTHCAGARALLGPRRAVTPWLTERLAAEPIESVSLEELIRFFENPSRWFLQRRLGIFLGREAGVLDDREPIELDELEKWRIGDALLRGTLSGAETESAWTRFRATGALPLGTPGRALYETLAAHVDALTRVAVAARDGDRLPPEELDLTIDGVRITGVLRDVWPAGLIAVRYSRLGERHEVGPWIRHLARNASHAPAAASALIGRAAKGDDPATVWFTPVREPQRHLAELLRLFRLGQCAPLPLFRIASRVFASTVAEPDGTLAHALEAARDRFPKQGFGRGDCDDPYVEELYRDRDPFDRATPAMPCEVSFTDTAHTVFDPLLSHRQADE